MALTFTSFTTFAEVEALYNSITPMRGEQNIGKAIRPIGDRNRKWERIVKISPNCYALSDGWHFGTEAYGQYHTHVPATLELMERYAPIVWRKKKDGTELVTLRNGTGEGPHTSRYQFLWRHTPRGLTFRNRNGKHFITTGGREYFLAKGRTYPRAEYNRLKERANTNGWAKAAADRAMVRDDNSALTFTNVQGNWHWVSGGRDIPKPPKKRVNKALKAKLKPHIDAFRDWAFTILPMLPTREYSYLHSIRSEAQTWIKENTRNPSYSWSLANTFSAEVAREIVADEAHPMRLHLAVSLADAMRQLPTDAETGSELKTQYNRWANRALGLTKEVKE